MYCIVYNNSDYLKLYSNVLYLVLVLDYVGESPRLPIPK